jgi:uncharacterized protein YdaU (DUF1376 family)
MVAKRYPYFPIYVFDFLSDQRVLAMSAEEVGAYFLLLLMAWQETPRGSLPNDEVALARWARVSQTQWSAISTRILPCFQLRADGRLHQRRLQTVCARLDDLSEKRAAAGLAGARKRWGTRKRATGKTVATASQVNGILQIPNIDPSPSDEGEGPSAFLAAWNATPHVRPAKALTGDRLKLFRARWADPAWRAQYPAALAAVPHSKFLRGENDRGWVPTLDWFLKPDTVTKVLEGAYADRPNGANIPKRDKPAPLSGVQAWLETQKPQGGDPHA